MHRIAFRRWLLPSIVFCSLWITPVAASDPLPSWNDGLTKRQIIEFFHSVTTAQGPHFVPVSQRIATFDNAVAVLPPRWQSSLEDDQRTTHQPMVLLPLS